MVEFSGLDPAAVALRMVATWRDPGGVWPERGGSAASVSAGVSGLVGETGERLGRISQCGDPGQCGSGGGDASEIPASGKSGRGSGVRTGRAASRASGRRVGTSGSSFWGKAGRSGRSPEKLCAAAGGLLSSGGELRGRCDGGGWPARSSAERGEHGSETLRRAAEPGAGAEKAHGLVMCNVKR
jgi:hypothetical protein